MKDLAFLRDITVLLKINMRSSSRAEKIGEEMALKILVERRHALKIILSILSK